MKIDWQEILVIVILFNTALYAISALLGKIAEKTKNKTDDKIVLVINKIVSFFNWIIKLFKGGAN